MVTRTIYIFILGLLLTQSASAQVLSQFDWELGGTSACNCENALIGPNAASVASEARAKSAGNGSPNGLAPGRRFGFINQFIDFVVAHPTNNAYFNVPSIELTIDHRNQRNEASADFFTRWNAVAFGSDCCGIVYISYQVDNGSGGFQQVGCPNNGSNGFNVGCAGQTATNTGTNSTLGSWHTFRFVYEQSTGIGEVFRDGVSSWQNFGIPGRALYWGNASAPGFVIGARCDGNGTTNTAYDNAQIAIPTPLPVTLNYFKGEKQGSESYLEWETASESNNHYFLVQKRLPDGVYMADGANAITLGRVDGAGTTSERTKYSFVDPNPKAGNNVYILRQVDMNGDNRAVGKVELSYTDFPDQIDEIYPNPVGSEQLLNIKFQSSQDDEVTFDIYSTAGNKVFSKTENSAMGINYTQIETHDLPSGVYLLKINQAGKSTIKKFIIAN